MKIELYSIEELSVKGWKYSESGSRIYLGNSKWPTMDFQASISHLLGKTFEYECLHSSRYGRGIVHAEITDHTGTYHVPQFLIKTKLPKLVLKTFSLPGSNEKANYNGTKFHFSCSLSDLKKSDAILLAKWVLRMSK